MKRFVRSGAAELCVEDSGVAGAPVVCLHAGVTDKRLWGPQIEAFDASHRMIAYDRRGFGETRLPPLAARDAFSHVGDLLAVMDALSMARVVLMGCSQGGRIAIDLALAHPERVRALVLVACSVIGAPPPEDPWPPIVQARMAACEAAEKRGDQAALNELEAQLWLDGPMQPTGRVDGELRELFLAMNAIVLAAGSPGEELAPPSAWERLEQIRVPTLVIWGTLDFPHLLARMDAVTRRIPNARSVVLDGVAHLPGLERPAAFNAALRSFLEALPPDATAP